MRETRCQGSLLEGRPHVRFGPCVLPPPTSPRSLLRGGWRGLPLIDLQNMVETHTPTDTPVPTYVFDP